MTATLLYIIVYGFVSVQQFPDVVVCERAKAKIVAAATFPINAVCVPAQNDLR